MCPGRYDTINGKQLSPDSCMPAMWGDCHQFCMPNCADNEQICHGKDDSMGCPTADYCYPMEKGCPTPTHQTKVIWTYFIVQLINFNLINKLLLLNNFGADHSCSGVGEKQTLIALR